MIKLILVEDYSIIRAGLRMLLNRYEDLNIVAEASNGIQARDLIRKHKPDIVLMDIELPQLSGLEVTKMIAAELPETYVLILSNYVSEEFVLKAVWAGAKGYIKKDAHISEIRNAIDTIMGNQTYFAPEVTSHMIEFISQRPQVKSTVEIKQDVEAVLTPRQIEILTLIAQGLSTREISQEICISHKTVEAHRANIMKRLNIFHVAGLTKYAWEHGLTKT